MCLNYLGADRLDAMRDIRELTQRMQGPTEFDMRCLKHVTRYLMGTADYGVWMPWPAAGMPVKLETAVDSDWAADKASRKSIVCYDVRADGCPLHAAVRQQSFIALSSGEAEFGGVHAASTESLLFKRLLEWLGMEVSWVVEADS
eukprot:4798631-Lingulodinium_polyedra.AAC.1